MIKRTLDIVISGLALLLLLPLGLLIAVACACTGDHEVFFRQRRIGRGGRPFNILKFSSMRKAPTALMETQLTVRNDPRVHLFGRFLRKTKLNELPQLLNVLKGDMSLIGPRPMLPTELGDLTADVSQRVCAATPGITGIGSLVFRDEEAILSASSKGVRICYSEDVAPLKADLELWYTQRQSLWLDLRILALTVWLILRPGSQAYGRLLGDDWPAFRQRIDDLYRGVGLAPVSKE
jgi:lipopolysaccharide/colanic/teichoic acid biosynthesis glycosyltransferase